MTRHVTDLAARRFQVLLAADQNNGRLPSLVAGVVRDGDLVWTGCHGSRTGGAATSANTQYRIGSITKTMTAVLVLQLREEGRLDLADPIGKHLPGIAYSDRTIRTLLSHSSGMHSEPVGSWWERSPGGTFEQLAAGLDDGQAPFVSGHTFHYTNVAFALLGEVVARLRGCTWEKAIDRHILQPLGMNRTGYQPQPPTATGYSVHPFAGTLTEEPAQDTGAMAPAGQVWSTVEDLARYATFLVEGHHDVLPGTVLDEMTIPQSGSLAGGIGAGYGLGFRLVAGGAGTLVGHSGSMPGFLAGLFVDRARRTGAVCLANGTSGLRAEGLPQDMLATLEELEPTIAQAWTPSESVPEAVSEVLGVWHWGNTAYAFSYLGGEVVASQLGSSATSYAFRPQPDGTFLGITGYHHGETLRVVRNDDGSINHLVCATFVYTRVPYDPAAPIPGGI